MATALAVICMSDWLSTGFESGQDRWIPNLWIPNHNKICLSYEEECAREFFGRPQQRLQFHSALGQAMLATATRSGGYIEHLSFFNKWDTVWTADRHPGCSLQAARQHRFHRMKMNYTNGVDYASLAGFGTCGQTGPHQKSASLTFTVWTSALHPRLPPRSQCLGRTGRRWHLRRPPSRRWTRRRRTRRTCNLHISFRRVHRWLLHSDLRMLRDNQCPQHVLVHILTGFRQSYHMRVIQLLLWIEHAASIGKLPHCLYIWARNTTGRGHRSIMANAEERAERSSDSDVIERGLSPSRGPVGPAPTTPRWHIAPARPATGPAGA